MNVLLNNPYDEVLDPNLDFSSGYFDAVVNDLVNRDMLVDMLKASKNDVEDSVDFLWKFLPIDPSFKVGCNVEQAKNVIRYLINKA